MAISVKNCKFFHSHIFNTPLRECPLELCNGGSTQKLGSCFCQSAETFHDICIHTDTIPQCDDRWTELLQWYHSLHYKNAKHKTFKNTNSTLMWQNTGTSSGASTWSQHLTMFLINTFSIIKPRFVQPYIVHHLSHLQILQIRAQYLAQKQPISNNSCTVLSNVVQLHSSHILCCCKCMMIKLLLISENC